LVYYSNFVSRIFSLILAIFWIYLWWVAFIAAWFAIYGINRNNFIYDIADFYSFYLPVAIFTI